MSNTYKCKCSKCNEPMAMNRSGICVRCRSNPCGRCGAMTTSTKIKAGIRLCADCQTGKNRAAA